MTENTRDEKKEETKVEVMTDFGIGKLLAILGGISALVLAFFVASPYINVSNGEIGITESFFSKDVMVYEKPGLSVINPFSFAKKTYYPAGYQLITFSSSFDQKGANDAKNKEVLWNGTTTNVSENVNLPAIQTMTSDGNNVGVEIAVSYEIPKDASKIAKIYASAGTDYVNRIVAPSISSSVSDITSEYSFADLVGTTSNDGKDRPENIMKNLKETIKTKLENSGFNVVSITFSNTIYSDDMKKKVEDLFQKQNELRTQEIEKQKVENELSIIEARNKNSKKENEAISDLLIALKAKGISVSEWQKVKMTKIFESKWNGTFLPDNAGKIISGTDVK